MTYRYSPGAWFGVVTPGGLALLPETLRVDVVEDVWARLEAGEGLGAVLDALNGAFGTSIASLPPFGVVLVADGGVQLALRGPIIVDVLGEEGAVTVKGTGVTTWAERRLEGVTQLRIAIEGATDDAVGLLPIVSGVVLCDVLTTLDAFVLSEPSSEPAAPGAGLTFPEPVPESALAGEPASEETLIPAVTVIGVEPERPTEATEQRGAEPADYDELFGETVMRSVEDAAIRAEETEAEALPATPIAALTAPTAPAESVPSPEPAGPESFYISGIPDFSQPGPNAQPSPPSVPAGPALVGDEEGDHDGETVSVAQLRAMRASREAESATPAPAVAVLSTGERFTLDRGLIVGRSPRVSRATGEVPNLATVPSPDADISRSHLELRVEGSTILAVDLNTTNGSQLVRPGADPVRLHPSEPTIIVPGDVISLGDGVTIAIEAAQ